MIEIRGDTKNQMHPLYSVPKLPETYLPSTSPGVASAEQPSARPTQYSMQRFDLPTRPSPQIFPNLDALTPLPGSLFSVVSGKGWGEVSQESDASPGRGSAIGIDFIANPYDIDTSGGQTSSGLSPGHSSSNTSYSPPSQDDDSGSTNVNATSYQPTGGPTGQTPSLFELPNVATSARSQSQRFRSDFKTSSSWNFDPAAANCTPSHVLGNVTGMTPPSDGDWSHLLDNMDNMDNMNWENTAFGADATQ